MFFKPCGRRMINAVTFAVELHNRVKQILFFLLLQIFAGAAVQAQAPVQPQPSPVQRLQPPAGTQVWPIVSWVSSDAPESRMGKPFQRAGTPWKVYSAIGLLLIFGICRRVFDKYYSDMTGLMFRSTLKGRQIREQMQNAPLPALVFNLFFAVSGGLFLFLLLGYYRQQPLTNPWLAAALCMALVLLVYLVKYLALKFFGWLFNSVEVTNTYIFVVFYMNKIVGILLVPVVVLLMLSAGQMTDIVVVTGLCGVAALLLYRYILAYGPAAKTIQIPPFHFFLYICSVEIAPVLLIYKVLFQLADNKL
jgi:hypothetical protein